MNIKYCLFLLLSFFSVAGVAGDYNEVLSEEYNTYLLNADDKKLRDSADSSYYKPIVLVQSSLDRRFGYVVGDLLQRTIYILHHNTDVIELKSLPLVGNDVKGIELRAINYSDSCDIDDLSFVKEKINADIVNKISGTNFKKSCLLKVNYTYQVFSSKVVAKPAALPPEYFKFVNKSGGLQMIRSDNIKFRISPLAVYGNVDLIEEIGNDAILPNIEVDKYKKLSDLGLITVSIAILLLVISAGYGIYLKMQSPFYKIFNKLNQDLYKDELSLILDIRFVFNAEFARNIFEDEVRDNKILTNIKDTSVFKEIQWFYAISSEFLFQKNKDMYTLEIFETKKKDYIKFLKSLIKNRYLLSQERIDK